MMRKLDISDKNFRDKKKSGVRVFVKEKFDICKELINGHDKKIILGTFIVFIGSGLIASGIVEKQLTK